MGVVDKGLLENIVLQGLLSFRCHEIQNVK